MNKIYLPNGFRINYDDVRGRYELEHSAASMFYMLQDPRGFPSLDAWIDHIERTGNAAPGSFTSHIKGAYDGKHWQTSSSVYSGTTTSAGPSSRGTAARVAGASPNTIYNALRSGLISASDAADALGYGVAATNMHHSLASYGGLGGGHAQAQAMYHQQMQLMQQAMMYGNAIGITGATAGPPHEPTKLKPDGLHPGEIIAWRAWNIKDDDLVSVVAEGKPWSATEPMNGDAAAGYGVHAYKAPHGPLLDSYVEKGSSKLWVIGEIALWGDIIEHEDGYRAEYGRVHSLVTWHDKVPSLQRKMISFKYLQAQPAFKIDDAA